MAEAGDPFVVADRPADGVLRLTLSRPERRNALSSSAMTELLGRLVEAAGDEAVRSLLIAAEGPVYSAGHDLRELRDLRGPGNGGAGDTCAAVFELCSRLMLQLVHSPKPSIAVVQGLATAAGCQLVASCDLAVASESAAFATPGVDIGLFCSTPSVALSRNVPRKVAMEMLLLGEPINARRAHEIGLVNRVVAADDLGAVALDLASTIAAKPRGTVADGKARFHRQLEMPLEEAYLETSRAMAEALLADDAGEGIGAFLDKRSPRWNEG